MDIVFGSNKLCHAIALLQDSTCLTDNEMYSSIFCIGAFRHFLEGLVTRDFTIFNLSRFPINFHEVFGYDSFCGMFAFIYPRFACTTIQNNPYALSVYKIY